MSIRLDASLAVLGSVLAFGCSAGSSHTDDGPSDTSILGDGAIGIDTGGDGGTFDVATDAPALDGADVRNREFRRGKLFLSHAQLAANSENIGTNGTANTRGWLVIVFHADNTLLMQGVIMTGSSPIRWHQAILAAAKPSATSMNNRDTTG